VRKKYWDIKSMHNVWKARPAMLKDTLWSDVQRRNCPQRDEKLVGGKKNNAGTRKRGGSTLQFDRIGDGDGEGMWKK